MTILTQDQMRQSIADAFSRSVESAYKDLLDAAVRAERERCLRLIDEHVRAVDAENLVRAIKEGKE